MFSSRGSGGRNSIKARSPPNFVSVLRRKTEAAFPFVSRSKSTRAKSKRTTRHKLCRFRWTIPGSPVGLLYRPSLGRKCWRRSCELSCSATKGRDLYDLSHALETFDGLDVERIALLFSRYLEFAGQSISRAQAEERMFSKLANPRLLTDMRPLLPLTQAEALSQATAREAFVRVFEKLVVKIAGDTWVRTAEMKERFGLGSPSVQNVP